VSARAEGVPAGQTLRLRVVPQSGGIAADRTHLLLPGGTARPMNVRLEPPSGSGLETAMLTLVDGAGRQVGSVLATLAAPVHFQPPDDGKTARTIRNVGVLGPARLQRFYYHVPRGATQLRLALSVPTAVGPATAGAGTAGGATMVPPAAGPQGRVRMHVLRPDGRRLYLTAYIGAGAVNAVTRTVDSPVAGTWEVVVYSSPALSGYSLGESRYVLEAALDWLDITPASWQGVVPEGRKGQATFDLANYTGRPIAASTHVFGPSLGMARLEPVIATVRPGENYTRILPEVTAGRGLLRVAVANPSDPGADLDLFLYRFDAAQRQWVTHRSAQTPGVSHEVVEVYDPPAGQYAVSVEARHAGGEVAFEFTEAILDARSAVAEPVAKGPRAPGEKWRVTIDLPASARAEESFAQLVVADGASEQAPERALGIVPLVVETGKRQLIVGAVAGGRLADGGFRVTLSVRDRTTKLPAEVAVKVNGRVYFARRGQVTVTVAAAARLVVELLDPYYEAVSRVFMVEPDRGVTPTANPAETGASPGYLETLRLRLSYQLLGG
jgi:hypothetical protein